MNSEVNAIKNAWNLEMKFETKSVLVIGPILSTFFGDGTKEFVG